MDGFDYNLYHMKMAAACFAAMYEHGGEMDDYRVVTLSYELVFTTDDYLSWNPEVEYITSLPDNREGRTQFLVKRVEPDAKAL